MGGSSSKAAVPSGLDQKLKKRENKKKLVEAQGIADVSFPGIFGGTAQARFDLHWPGPKMPPGRCAPQSTQTIIIEDGSARLKSRSSRSSGGSTTDLTTLAAQMAETGNRRGRRRVASLGLTPREHEPNCARHGDDGASVTMGGGGAGEAHKALLVANATLYSVRDRALS